MSDYERHKGTVKIVSTNPDEFEFLARMVYEEWGFEIQIDEDYTFCDCIRDELYDKYIITDKIFAKIESKELEDEDTYINMSKVNDYTYSFETRFYNGGTCLSEMLESELSKETI